MELSDISEYVQLGGTVTTVVLFLRYLSTRDNKWVDSLKNSSDSNVILAKALQRLTDTVMQNTNKITENVPEVAKNTEALKENTEKIEEAK